MLTGPNDLTVNTNDGVAAFTGLNISSPGSYTLQITTGSGASQMTTTTRSIAVTPGAPSKLFVTGQPPSSVTAGGAFSLQVVVDDKFNNPISSFSGPLNLSASVSSNASGATLLGQPTFSTDSDGVTTVGNLVIGTAGSYTIAIAGTVAGQSVQGTVSGPVAVAAGSPNRLMIASPPTTVATGSPFGVNVEVTDYYGNPVPDTGSVSLQVVNSTTEAPAAALSGNLTNGQAAFQNLSLTTSGSYTIQATSAGLQSTSDPLSVTAASPDQVVVQVPPPGRMKAGAGFGLTVQVEDRFGNDVSQSNIPVTVGLSAGPANASLSGGPFMVTTDGQGVAAFPANGLALDTAGSGYVLQVTSPGLAAVTAGPLTVIAGAATHLSILVQPPSVVLNGSSFGLVVAAEDAYHNVDPTFGGSVILSPPSGVTLSGGTTVTPSQGQATFSGLVLGQTNSPVPLTAIAAGLGSVVTDPVAETTPAVLRLPAQTITVAEDARQAVIQILRTGGYEGAVTVQVATSGGSAVPGVNYTPVNETVTLPAGQDSMDVAIPILNADNLTTSPRLLVSLSSPGTNASLGGQATATIQILNAGQTTASPQVSLENVQVLTRKRKVTGIVLPFDGALNASQAGNVGEYTLIQAGKKNSFTARNARHIAIGSASYNSANDTVPLTPRGRLVLREPLQLTLNETLPSGLQDNHGKALTGHSVAVITRGGTNLEAVPVGPAAVDQLVVLGELPTFTKVRKK